MTDRPGIPIGAVSVVVICYQQADCIARAVRSVLDQTRLDLVDRILVVDDGSTDGSWNVIERLAAEHPLVEGHRQENSGGASAPRNRGIALATGTHVAFLDGDDAWTPDKLANDLAANGRAPEAGLYYGDYAEAAAGEPPRRPRVNRFDARDAHAFGRLYAEGGPILPSTALVLREALAEVGGFDEALRYNEEADLWLRLAARYPLQHVGAVQLNKTAWEGSLGSDRFAAESLAVHRLLTDRFAARHPELARWRPAREARIAVREGALAFARGDRAAARRAFGRAVRRDPARRKAWAYLALSCLPARGAALLQNRLRTS